MGLYKNSKERFSNREVARKLIHSWARPIFGLTSDYKSLTREDRMDADLRHMVKSRKRRRKTEDEVILVNLIIINCCPHCQLS